MGLFRLSSNWSEFGSSAMTMSPAELERVELWMLEEFLKKTNEAAQAIYNRRLELGYMLPNGLDQNIEFWLNQYPAMAAWILSAESGQQVPQEELAVWCAGQASLIVDSTWDAQVAATKNIESWFGGVPFDDRPRPPVAPRLQWAMGRFSEHPLDVLPEIRTLYRDCATEEDFLWLDSMVIQVVAATHNRPDCLPTLGNLFRFVYEQAPPPNGTRAASCYWRILELGGESVLRLASDSGARTTYEGYNRLFQWMGTTIPRRESIPRFDYLLEPRWLPDIHLRHELRWWDGESWTDQVSDGGVPAIDSPASATDLLPPQPTVPPAAAWLPDPQGRHELRYWDGHAWSEHVSDAGVQSAD
jgi:hypothetical protein